MLSDVVPLFLYEVFTNLIDACLYFAAFSLEFEFLSFTMKLFQYNEPFVLETGAILPQISIAYHTYGKLNSDKSNVVWVCHASDGQFRRRSMVARNNRQKMATSILLNILLFVPIYWAPVMELPAR